MIGVEQTRDGTFFFSSKDLCMIEHIPELISTGVDSFKIEGRMKSAYYAAVTANIYRTAIDKYLSDPAGYRFDPAWMNELESVSHREYDTGFFFDRPCDDAKTTKTTGYVKEKSYLALVTGYDEKSRLAKIEQRNKTSVGDRVEVISPGCLGKPFTVTELFNAEMQPIDSIPHPKMEAYIRVPFEVRPGDMIRI